MINTSTNTKFAYNDEVKIVKGFYRGVKGKVLETGEAILFEKRRYRIGDEMKADYVWVRENEIELVVESSKK